MWCDVMVDRRYLCEMRRFETQSRTLREREKEPTIVYQEPTELFCSLSLSEFWETLRDCKVLDWSVQLKRMCTELTANRKWFKTLQMPCQLVLQVHCGCITLNCIAMQRCDFSSFFFLFCCLLVRLYVNSCLAIKSTVHDFDESQLEVIIAPFRV